MFRRCSVLTGLGLFRLVACGLLELGFSVYDLCLTARASRFRPWAEQQEYLLAVFQTTRSFP